MQKNPFFSSFTRTWRINGTAAAATAAVVAATTDAVVAAPAPSLVC